MRLREILRDEHDRGFAYGYVVGAMTFSMLAATLAIKHMRRKDEDRWTPDRDPLYTRDDRCPS